EVWNTSSTQGYAYFVNYQTNEAGSIGFNPPSGTSLIGNSAEWVVERPEVGGSLATLTNYVWDNLTYCYAYTWAGTKWEPGSTGSNLIVMETGGTHISFPQLQ